MRFVEIINKKKFTLIDISLFIYLIFNLLEGERGLISFYENEKLIKQLNHEKILLSSKVNLVEKKINLLTGEIDTDYLETLYRKNFMVGKSNERIYTNN